MAWSWSASAVLVAFSVPAPSLRPRQSHDGLDRLNFLPLSPPPLVIVWFLPEKMSFASSSEKPSKVNKTGSSISGLSLRQAVIEGRAEEEPRWLLDSRGVGGGGSSLYFLLLLSWGSLGRRCRSPVSAPEESIPLSPSYSVRGPRESGEGGKLSWAGEKVLWGGERRGRKAAGGRDGGYRWEGGKGDAAAIEERKKKSSEQRGRESWQMQSRDTKRRRKTSDEAEKRKSPLLSHYYGKRKPSFSSSVRSIPAREEDVVPPSECPRFAVSERKGFSRKKEENR